MRCDVCNEAKATKELLIVLSSDPRRFYMNYFVCEKHIADLKE